MQHKTIEKTLLINASPDTVWRVLTDPTLTKKMGGYYATDWKIGSDFGWKWNDGKTYTHGKILQLEKNKLIQHNLFDAKYRSVVASVITYRLAYANGKTQLHGKEETSIALDPEEYAEALAGWSEALQAVKEIAEGIEK